MTLSESINTNTYLAYKTTSDLKPQSIIKTDDFDWNSTHPKPLASICIEKLCENWNGKPKLEELINKDRELFLQILNMELPLQILVDNISSDIFWKRCYKSKWHDSPVISEENKWINAFMARYYADFLENLNPRQYDPVKVTILVKLCGPYIKKMCLRGLIPSDVPIQRNISPEMAELITSTTVNKTKQSLQSTELHTRDHISLHAVTRILPGMWEQRMKIQCPHRLFYLSITRTDMNCQKLKYILRGISDHNVLETLNFSHCQVGDDGLASLAKFISKHEHLRNIILSNNIFGPVGAESISHALNHSSCGLRFLDLQLNDKLGSEGVAHIAVSIARGCNLTSLNISGCGITSKPLMKAPAGVWSATSAENPPTCGDLLARAIGLSKTPLRTLDLSVNDVGSPSDNSLANAICLSHIVDINLKRSGMSSMSMAIAESAAAAQRLKRESEKGIRFRRSAGRLVQARRVAKGMNIDTDTVLLAQQLSARPSIVSVTSEDGTYSLIQTMPLPMDFGFIPSLKSPLPSSRNSSLTGPTTSRRSSHHMILEPVMELRRSVLVRRGSDGSLLQSRSGNTQRHIKIFVSNSYTDSD